jgi:ATP phosphoribosyltransferase regulatory subunit
MPSAWLLPEHIADVLPAQARRIEELRRRLLDGACAYGFELVTPPLLEHLESLLSGAGHALDLATFKLVDQLSGRTLGVRADTTSQVARIDAHLLNRCGVTRLCYCGPVLHARPQGVQASREPLQWGAEVYGHAGLEADLEVQELALDLLHSTQVSQLTLDLGDARIVRGILQQAAQGVASATELKVNAALQINAALASKDPSALLEAAAHLPQAVQNNLLALLQLYGSQDVLTQARSVLPQAPLITAALNDLEWLCDHLRKSYPHLNISFDLADLGGYAYYSGVRFALYTQGSSDALVRGGRYDEVGAVFGRSRPAVGFSTDLKQWLNHLPASALRPAIRAPWGEDTALHEVIRHLRAQGETVLCMLPGHEHEAQEFNADRELVLCQGQWVIQPC